MSEGTGREIKCLHGSTWFYVLRLSDGGCGGGPGQIEKKTEVWQQFELQPALACVVDRSAVSVATTVTN